MGADRQVAGELKQLPGVSSLRVATHAEPASETLIDMMVDRFFSVEIDVAGQTEEQINATLTEALTAQGFDGEISVHRDEAGVIHVETSDMPDTGDGRTELRIGLIDRQMTTEDEIVRKGTLEGSVEIRVEIDEEASAVE